MRYSFVLLQEKDERAQLLRTLKAIYALRADLCSSDIELVE